MDQFAFAFICNATSLIIIEESTSLLRPPLGLPSMPFIASSSSNSQPEFEWLYDIFLTFGTRHEAFLDLQTSLRNAAIKTFMDENGKITPTLLQAIKLSRIVIVAFSFEFVGSRNCLSKLDKIMEYSKNMGNKVYALFIEVTQSDLFERLAQELRTRKTKDDLLLKCRRWLGPESTLPGWTLQTSRDCNEIIIPYIKKELVKELGKTYFDIPRHQVETRFRVKEVLHFSKYYSKDYGEKYLTIVGIWGIGGVGKTTLARAIYEKVRDGFESKSFLKNIKNVLEKDNGQVCLQEQLISDISHATQGKVPDIETGIRQIMTVLDRKRALVVLDDVSGIDQLIKKLCTSRRFGFGSMIIITTRNKDLLDQLKVKYIYEMKKLDKSDSFELFKWNAFKQINPQPDAIIDLAEEVTEYCEGLPLLLEVLGSHLSGRRIFEWEVVLNKLKSIRKGQIQEKLKISFEYLDDSVKDLFISIACFYVSEKKQYVKQKLSGFGCPLESGMRMLIKRSLLKVDMDEKLDMHDLLQDIGKGINAKTPKSKYIYNVFLSFRGEDTRKSFTTHLCNAMKKAGIEVFMDNGIKSGKKYIILTDSSN